MEGTPSLDDICRVQIDKLSHIGDVDFVEPHLLEKILPHCSLQELARVEDINQGIDLSPVTNELWKKFYIRDFGDNYKIVEERLKQWKQGQSFWRHLYEARCRVVKAFEIEDARLLKESYETHNSSMI